MLITVILICLVPSAIWYSAYRRLQKTNNRLEERAGMLEGHLRALEAEFDPAPDIDIEEASELALQLRGDPITFPTRWKVANGEKRRTVAWDVALPQLEKEARLIGAAIMALLAEKKHLYTTSEEEVIELGRHAAMWWHAVDREDIPEDV